MGFVVRGPRPPAQELPSAGSDGKIRLFLWVVTSNSMPPRTRFRDVAPLLTEQVLPALYRAASVDPEGFYAQLRRRGVRVYTLDDLRRVDPDLVDRIARGEIRSARRMSALSGVGLGMGGWFAIPPDIASQVVALLKLAQRMSLLYGVDYRAGAGEIELWKAMAEAVGARVDLSGTPGDVARRLPAQVGRSRLALHPIAWRLAQAVVRRLALRVSTPLGRMVPVLSGGIGGATNYVQMGRAGQRMMAYYRARRGPGTTGPDAPLEVEVVRSPGDA